jgi:hypothetical protein
MNLRVHPTFLFLPMLPKQLVKVTVVDVTTTEVTHISLLYQKKKKKLLKNYIYREMKMIYFII